MSTEDKEKSYFEQAQEAFARTNEANINAGTHATDVSLEYGENEHVDDKLRSSGSADIAQNHIGNSAVINDTVGAVAATVANAVGPDKASELNEYDKQFDGNKDGKLDNFEEEAKKKQEELEAEQRAAVAKLVFGGAAFTLLSNAIGSDAQNIVEDLAHVPGNFKCAECKDANSLPTNAQTPNALDKSQGQFIS